MKIYSPVTKPLIRQGFGKENTNLSVMHFYTDAGEIGHDGFDFAVTCVNSNLIHGGQCDQVYCNVEGDGDLKITYIQKDDSNGYGIVAMDENWNKFLWWHFDIILPELVVGSILKPGQLLGVSGDTGKSTGAHVHFGYYPYGVDYNNGYHGAESPEPYYENRFIVDVENQIGIIKKMIEIINQLLKWITK